MTWISKLVKTYDNNSDAVGIIKDPDNITKVLLPIFHLTAKANVEVTINNNGEFIRAKQLSSKDNTGTTIIPITEASAGRSSGIAPMPLFDKLIYIAGDYKDRPISNNKNESDNNQADSKKNIIDLLKGRCRNLRQCLPHCSNQQNAQSSPGSMYLHQQHPGHHPRNCSWWRSCRRPSLKP